MSKTGKLGRNPLEKLTVKKRESNHLDPILSRRSFEPLTFWGRIQQLEIKIDWIEFLDAATRGRLQPRLKRWTEKLKSF